jgi:diphthamide synthase subunit DPH2
MKKRQFLKINTVKELSLQLGLPEAFLITTVDSIEACYRKFTDKDKKGKERIFYVANDNLKKVHQKINKLLDGLDYPINIQGGIAGRSIVTNASIHVGKKYVANYYCNRPFAWFILAIVPCCRIL